MIPFWQILLLAFIQGMAELLPVSSSAHVIVAEKIMGINPSSPEMTFLLVMLHTGTMFAVLFYFARRWIQLLTSNERNAFLKQIGVATIATGILGIGLKTLIEKTVFANSPKAEIEELFSNLPLISASLFAVGVLIFIAGQKKSTNEKLSNKSSLLIGIVQGICLPFRGFSRSGATISTALMLGVSRSLAEEFSFALAVVLTPPVVLRELSRLFKAHALHEIPLHSLLMPGILGMLFSFLAGLLALRWLSNWMERGRWKWFAYYCLLASATVLLVHLAIR